MIILDIVLAVIEFLIDCVKDLKGEFSKAGAILGLIYFGTFSGLIVSVIKMGVEGDLFWGFVALIDAIIILVIGFVTGVF